jgi:hypothetical protein
MVEIGYAKVGGPPIEWSKCKVFDVETGEEIDDVIEASAVGGFCLKYKRSADGKLIVDDANDRVVTERLVGKFRIEYVN